MIIIILLMIFISKPENINKLKPSYFNFKNNIEK